MPRKAEKPKLNNTSPFTKARLNRLRQRDETWEADFRILPKPMGQSKSHYRGMVVRKAGGALLAESHIEGRTSSNDMATLLTNAMRQPLAGKPHRPRRLYVRGHNQWRELFPYLEELGIKVSVKQELPQITKAFQEHLRQLRDAQRRSMVKPTTEQQAVEKLFPAVARWVRGYGYIEIGDQEMFGFVARALGYGGMPVEDDRPDTLGEALAALEKGLRKWYEEEGIELE